MPVLGKLTTLPRAGKLLLELNSLSPPPLVAVPTRSPVLPDATSRTTAYFEVYAALGSCATQFQVQTSIYPRGASKAYQVHNIKRRRKVHFRWSFSSRSPAKKALPDTRY